MNHLFSNLILAAVPSHDSYVLESHDVALLIAAVSLFVPMLKWLSAELWKRFTGDQRRLDHDQESLSRKLEAGLEKIDRRISSLEETLFGVRADSRETNTRIKHLEANDEKLEHKHAQLERGVMALERLVLKKASGGTNGTNGASHE